MKAAELREFMAPLNPESVPSIEQARQIIAERQRRVSEARDAHGGALIERAYSRGDDYVSQTRAALKDHRRRMRARRRSCATGGSRSSLEGEGIRANRSPRDERGPAAAPRPPGRRRQGTRPRPRSHRG